MSNYVENAQHPSETCQRRSGLPAQAMVELAFVLPILIMLIIGSLDIGRLFYDDIIVGNAVREGARQAINTSLTDSQIQTIVANAAPGLTLTGVTVTPATRTSTTFGAITVKATYSMTVFTPGISSLIGSPKAVVHSAVMNSLN
jgi:Flp pilus assembly protein TadG